MRLGTVLISAAIASTTLASPLPATSSLNSQPITNSIITETNTPSNSSDWQISGTGPEPLIPRSDLKTRCFQGWRVFFDTYHIDYIDGSWSGQDGEYLKQELKGCGTMTGWKWTWQRELLHQARFNLPLVAKHGCVIRAIKSAGGPDVDYCGVI